MPSPQGQCAAVWQRTSARSRCVCHLPPVLLSQFRPAPFSPRIGSLQQRYSAPPSEDPGALHAAVLTARAGSAFQGPRWVRLFRSAASPVFPRQSSIFGSRTSATQSHAPWHLRLLQPHDPARTAGVRLGSSANSCSTRTALLPADFSTRAVNQQTSAIPVNISGGLAGYRPFQPRPLEGSFARSPITDPVLTLMAALGKRDHSRSYPPSIATRPAMPGRPSAAMKVLAYPKGPGFTPVLSGSPSGSHHVTAGTGPRPLPSLASSWREPRRRCCGELTGALSGCLSSPRLQHAADLGWST